MPYWLVLACVAEVEREGDWEEGKREGNSLLRFSSSHPPLFAPATQAKLVSGVVQEQQQLYSLSQKYKNWIVCPANSGKASRGGARQVHE